MIIKEQQFNIADAKKNFSQLIRLTESGIDVYIAKNGKRIVQLVPVPKQKEDVSKRIGFAKDKLIITDDFDKVFDDLNEPLTEILIGGSIWKLL